MLKFVSAKDKIILKIT